MTTGVLGVYLVAAFLTGWAAGRRAPDGVEYYFWLKLSRRMRRRRMA